MPLRFTCQYPPCGAPFQVAPSRLKLGAPRFCSRPCDLAARRIGLVQTHPATSRRRMHAWTPEEEALVRAEYDSSPEALTRLVAALGRPRAAIKYKARCLGLARNAAPVWTPEEEEYLGAFLATLSIADLARHLGRTQTAVRLKAKRLHLNKATAGGYTMRCIEQLTGWDHHKIGWLISSGRLKAKRRRTERRAANGGDMWFISDAALYRCIIHWPEILDLRRVDRDWLLDLLTDGAVIRARMQRLAVEMGAKD